MAEQVGLATAKPRGFIEGAVVKEDSKYWAVWYLVTG